MSGAATSASGAAKGVFVVLEGGEGCGKSTQAALLAQSVTAAGRRPLVTREPGGSTRAEEIRSLLLADAAHPLEPRAEALLFAAARAEHSTHTIRPALASGAVVICDRFTDSSVAYQGVARGLGADWVRGLSDWATRGLHPDLTVVLDLEPELGLARAKDPNRLEAEPLEFHRAVRQAFLDFAASAPDRYVVVRADQPVDTVAGIVWEAVGRRMATSERGVGR